MAIQKKGPKLSGKVGGKIYAIKKGKTIVKEQSEKEHQLSAASINSGKDLAEASKHSKNVRVAFADMVKEYGDDTLYYRLNARFYDVIKPLPKTKQGSKKVQDGDISALVGFQFNDHCRLEYLLFKIPTVQVDTSGILTIDLPIGDEENITAVLADSNQVKLQLSLLTYNFKTESCNVIKMGDLVGSMLTPAKKKLELDLKGNLLLLVVIGVQYLTDGYRSFSRVKYAAAITHAFRFKNGKPVIFKSVAEKVEKKVVANNDVAWDD